MDSETSLAALEGAWIEFIIILL